jgi:hypothetical protein
MSPAKIWVVEVRRYSRLPRGINIERMRDPEPNWAKQFHDLGLNRSTIGWHIPN